MCVYVCVFICVAETRPTVAVFGDYSRRPGTATTATIVASVDEALWS